MYKWTTKHHLHILILHTLEQVQRAFPLSGIAFRCMRNLRDLLVQAILSPTSEKLLGNTMCSELLL